MSPTTTIRRRLPLLNGACLSNDAGLHHHRDFLIITEYFLPFVEFCDQISPNQLKPKNGYIDLPQEPGLGIDIDEERLRAFPTGEGVSRASVAASEGRTPVVVMAMSAHVRSGKCSGRQSQATVTRLHRSRGNPDGLDDSGATAGRRRRLARRIMRRHGDGRQARVLTGGHRQV